MESEAKTENPADEVNRTNAMAELALLLVTGSSDKEQERIRRVIKRGDVAGFEFSGVAEGVEISGTIELRRRPEVKTFKV